MSQSTPAPTQKLHKVLAQAALGSRRDMEALIASGRVTVNGAIAHVGARVGPHDVIKVAGRVIHTRAGTSLPRVLLYHKPEGEIVSRSDPGRRPSVFERLPALSGAKWIAVGRLDFNTCGLLIFTTSGELANRLMHPRYAIEREYAVRVRGRLEAHHLRRLTQGIALDDGPARCLRVEERGGSGSNQWWHVVVEEGRNRVVRRMFEVLGLTVSRLMRVRYGMIELPPRLSRGRSRELSADETRQLLAWLDRAASPSAPAVPRARAETRNRRPRPSPAR